MIVIKPEILSNQHKKIKNNIKQTKGISIIFNFAKIPFLQKQFMMDNKIMLVEGEYKDLLKDITPQDFGKYLSDFSKIVFYMDAVNHDVGVLSQLEKHMTKQMTVVMVDRRKK